MKGLVGTSARAQTILAILMGLPGLVCAIAPRPLLEFSLTNPNAITDELVLIFQCFGSQAALVGMVLASASQIGRTGFRAFAAAMIPYLAFNASVILGYVNAIALVPILLDGVNNVVMLFVALAGASLCPDHDKKKAR